MTNPFFVYILRCENGSFYTGYTDDLRKRYRAHQSGKGSKYTRSFKPKEIAQCWKIDGDKSFAMKIEQSIKRFSRQEKENVVADPKRLLGDVRIQLVDANELQEFNRC